MEKETQKIVPNLWFDREAKEAVNFYTRIFKNSAVKSVTRYPEAGQEIHGMKGGSVMTVSFQLNNFNLLALNGGPHFKFNPSISMFVLFSNKEELQKTWEELVAGGEVMMPLDRYDWSPKYGWLQDRFKLSWQLMLIEDRVSGTEIVPLLFFTGNQHKMAGEAIKFYTSVFNNSEIEGILKYDNKNEYSAGGVMHAQFKLESQPFMAMDSGVENNYPFNEAISFIISCRDQEEIDYYWEKLGEEGDPGAQQCGWLKDRFGVSWQVVPQKMEEFLKCSEKEKANRTMAAMMQMKKIDLAALEAAFKNNMKITN